MLTYLLMFIFFAAFAVLIVANVALNRTRWFLCPRCWHWHNEIGERTEYPPTRGELCNQSRTCKACHE